jgi:hypothetical protein
VTDRLSIESKNWENQTHKEWLRRIKKELKLEDLSDKVLHIDKDVIYDPYKEYPLDKPALKIKNYPQMNMGVTFDPIDELSFNNGLMELLRYDLRSVRLKLDRIMDWEIMMKGVHMNLITWIIDCDKDIIVSFESFISQSDNKNGITVIYVGESTDDDSMKVLSYILEDNLPGAQIINRIISDLISTNGDSICVELKIGQSLLHTIPLLRAIRLHIEQTYPNKKLYIAAYSMIEQLSDNANQQLIITGSVAMQCSMAGVDFLFPTYDNTSIGMENLRLMLNIQNVMELESYTHKVSDPLSGSYLIDDITQQYLDLIDR